MFADRGDVLFIDIDEAYVVTGARQPATNDPANRPGADHNHAIAHFLPPLWNAANILNARNGVNRSLRRDTLEQTRSVT
jgi:hypothetical protein